MLAVSRAVSRAVPCVRVCETNVQRRAISCSPIVAKVSKDLNVMDWSQVNGRDVLVALQKVRCQQHRQSWRAQLRHQCSDLSKQEWHVLRVHEPAW